MRYANSTAAPSKTATPSGPSRPQLIDWQTPPEQICDTTTRRSRAGSRAAPPTCATTRSTATWPTRADQPALIAVSSETGTERIYTFRELHAEVQRMAAMLQALGVGRATGC